MEERNLDNRDRDDRELEVLTPLEKRQLRRQRRIRNQVIAYVSLAIVVVVLLGGGIFGTKKLTELINQKNQEQQIQEQLTQMSEEAIPEEELVPEEIIEEVPVQPTKEELLDEIVDARISEMTLEDKVAGLFLVNPESITGVTTAVKAGEGTKEALEKYKVGGLVYFAKNIQSAEQIKEMLANTASYSATPLFLAVDEEGGRVTRLASTLKLEDVGPMATIGATNDPSQAYAAMQKVGGYLKEHGFNLNFAPVADVLTNPDNKDIGDRSFGSDPSAVASMVTSAASGLKDSGIISCIKHFPGIGAASGNTHTGLVVVDRSLEELRSVELVPYQAAIEAGVPMIMVGHISLPQIIGDNTPATMSSAILSQLLRADLGFNGVIITDAMNMQAITDYYGADEAAIMALKAGADMILMPEDFELAWKGVIAAVQDGTIAEERINDSLKRVYRIKYADAVSE